MSIDLSPYELTLLSQILNDFFDRDKRFHFLSCNQSAILGNLINKVDNEMSV